MNFVNIYAKSAQTCRHIRTSLLTTHTWLTCVGRLYTIQDIMAIHNQLITTYFIILVAANITILNSSQKTADFDLYIVFDPLIAKMQAIALGNKLIRWIRVSLYFNFSVFPTCTCYMYVANAYSKLAFLSSRCT